MHLSKETVKQMKVGKQRPSMHKPTHHSLCAGLPGPCKVKGKMANIPSCWNSCWLGRMIMRNPKWHRKPSRDVVSS